MVNENDKDKADEEVKASDEKDTTVVVEYSTIKRMLGTLDRFLTRQFMLVVGLCTAVISGCILGLMFENAVLGHAFSPGGMGSGSGGGDLTTNVWLGSLLAVAVFIIIVAVVINIKKRKRKGA